MTPEQINRKIAEKVMGWDYDPLGGILDDHRHPAYIAQDSSWIRVEDWNPAERWDHAGMVLEKFDQYALWKIKQNEYVARIFFGQTPSGEWSWVKGEADIAPMAICLAALEAVKTKEQK